MPSKSAASKPSRRTTTKVAPTGYSATILPWFDLLKSSTNTYVPGFSARTRMLTVLPGGTTFSNLSSLLSTSAAFASLFVTTSKDAKAAEVESKELRFEKVVPPGKTVSIRVRALKPGTYVFVDDFNKSNQGKIVAE